MLRGEGIGLEKVSAAMSMQLLQFTEWPDRSHDSGPIVIGVFDDDLYFEEFSRLIEGPKFKGAFEVKTIPFTAVSDDFDGFDAIFFSGRNLRNTSIVLNKLGERPIALIGSFEEFLEMGGMVWFHSKQNRLTFDVDLANAKKHGIEFRAKLLRLANRVVDDE